MFTGLVQQVGTLVLASAGKLLIRPAHRIENPVTGESIAVNGCCLTLEQVDSSGTLVFHTLAETLSRTNLGGLPPGSAVNLERALALGDRLGGHLVQGHVDATARVISQTTLSDNDVELKVGIPQNFAAELVEKGSITIDGVSLTVASLEEDCFTVRLIPQTLKDTALRERTAGKLVNLEGDIVGKYVRRFLELERKDRSNDQNSGSITYEKLREAGFL